MFNGWVRILGDGIISAGTAFYPEPGGSFGLTIVLVTVARVR